MKYSFLNDTILICESVTRRFELIFLNTTYFAINPHIDNYLFINYINMYGVLEGV